MNEGWSRLSGRVFGNFVTALFVFLSVFLLVNFFLFASLAGLGFGVDSQWLYNVRMGGSGGLGTYWFEEKVWLESIVYCEEILCFKMVKTNPTHLHHDYLTGDNRLIKSMIIDKEDGTVYEIRYDPPLLLMPKSVSVGDVWVWNSVASVKVVSRGSVWMERLPISNVESRVVEKLFLTGSRGSIEGFLVEEKTDGVLTKRMIYSPTIHQPVRYEIPVSVTWGELIDVSLRTPSLLDFLKINIVAGFELRYLLILLVTVGFLRFYLWLYSRWMRQ